jgi:hypothetical protein
VARQSKESRLPQGKASAKFRDVTVCAADGPLDLIFEQL